MGKGNYNTGKQISSLIRQADTRLGKLTATAERISHYQQAIRKLLEPSCQEHCWLAGYSKGKLTLQSDSAVWATRIRMQQRQIISELSKLTAFADITAVKVTIRPRSQRAAPKQEAKPISAESAQTLLGCADAMEDCELKTALEKLGGKG